MGCKFALDDFGTGMSSFTHLKELPVDVLKIDGMFVSSLGTQAVNVAIVRAVQDIANALDLVTVAEWVENANIMRRVVDLGVDYVQGFAIQPPCPLTAIFEQQPAPLILPGLGNIRRISGGAI